MSPRLLTFLKVLGIAFSIVLSAELILRITGHYIVPQEMEYGDLSLDKDKIRILAIGESTTHDGFARGKSWASQLEKLLNDKGHNVRIYNVAQVGSNSALLLSRLPDQLEIFRPHIVMTMMGINDTENLVYDFAEPEFRLQKLYRLLRERVISKLSCELERVEPRAVNPQNMAVWLPMSGKESLRELEKQIRLKVKSDEEVATTLAVISSVIKNRNFPYDEARFMHLLDRAHEIHPRNEIVLKILLAVTTNGRNSRCLEIAREILPCGVNLTDEFLKLIVDCHVYLDKPLAISTFGIKGLSLMSTTGVTAGHYRKIAALLREKRISLVAMQYPTLSTDTLEHILRDDKDVVFISNEENFRNALAKHKFKDIFQDNFRVTWGHTTEMGHGLIAQSAFREMEPLVRKMKKSKR